MAARVEFARGAGHASLRGTPAVSPDALYILEWGAPMRRAATGWRPTASVG